MLSPNFPPISFSLYNSCVICDQAALAQMEQQGDTNLIGREVKPIPESEVSKLSRLALTVGSISKLLHYQATFYCRQCYQYRISHSGPLSVLDTLRQKHFYSIQTPCRSPGEPLMCDKPTPAEVQALALAIVRDTENKITLSMPPSQKEMPSSQNKRSRDSDDRSSSDTSIKPESKRLCSDPSSDSEDLKPLLAPSIVRPASAAQEKRKSLLGKRPRNSNGQFSSDTSKSESKRLCSSPSSTSKDLKPLLAAPTVRPAPAAPIDPSLIVADEIWYETAEELKAIIDKCCANPRIAVSQCINYILKTTKSSFWCTVKNTESGDPISLRFTIGNSPYFSDGIAEKTFEDQPQRHFAIHAYEDIASDYSEDQLYHVKEKQTPILSIRLGDLHGELVSVKAGKKTTGTELLKFVRTFESLYSKIPFYIYDGACVGDMYLSALDLAKEGSWYNRHLGAVISNKKGLIASKSGELRVQNRDLYHAARNTVRETPLADCFNYCQKAAPYLVDEKRTSLKELAAWAKRVDTLIACIDSNASKFQGEKLQSIITQFKDAPREGFIQQSKMTIKELIDVCVVISNPDVATLCGRQSKLLRYAHAIREDLHDIVCTPRPLANILAIPDPDTQSFLKAVCDFENTRIWVVLPKECSKERADLL